MCSPYSQARGDRLFKLHSCFSGRHPLLLYNGMAFDSCFPLRDQKGGLRESIRTSLFCFCLAVLSHIAVQFSEEGIKADERKRYSEVVQRSQGLRFYTAGERRGRLRALLGNSDRGLPKPR